MELDGPPKGGPEETGEPYGSGAVPLQLHWKNYRFLQRKVMQRDWVPHLQFPCTDLRSYFRRGERDFQGLGVQAIILLNQ